MISKGVERRRAAGDGWGPKTQARGPLISIIVIARVDWFHADQSFSSNKQTTN